MLTKTVINFCIKIFFCYLLKIGSIDVVLVGIYLVFSSSYVNKVVHFIDIFVNVVMNLSALHVNKLVFYGAIMKIR